LLAACFMQATYSYVALFKTLKIFPLNVGIFCRTSWRYILDVSTLGRLSFELHVKLELMLSCAKRNQISGQRSVCASINT
jgi:hypothetical protein